jgi:predicted nucleic acid-binding Zn finger protein
MDQNFNSILDEIEKKGAISDSLRKHLLVDYGLKFSNAEGLVSSNAVKKYIFMPSGKIIWIVVGREKEYFVMPDFYCQCDDFYINVVIRKRSKICYHLFAQALAERLGNFEVYEVPDSDFIRLNNEWKKQSI